MTDPFSESERGGNARRAQRKRPDLKIRPKSRAKIPVKSEMVQTLIKRASDYDLDLKFDGLEHITEAKYRAALLVVRREGARRREEEARRNEPKRGGLSSFRSVKIDITEANDNNLYTDNVDIATSDEQVLDDKNKVDGLGPVFEGSLDRDFAIKALKLAQGELGLSQRKFADRLGISEGSLRQVYRGEATIDRSLELLNKLGYGFDAELVKIQPK